MAPKEKRPPGRPPETPGDIKTYPLNLRTTRARRKELEASAHKASRSLARQVEHLIDQALSANDVRAEVFGGPENYNLMKILATSVEVISERRGKSWLEDKETYEVAEVAIVTILRAFAPTQGGKGFTETIRREGNEAAADVLYCAIADILGVESEDDKEKRMVTAVKAISVLLGRDKKD